MGELWHGNHFLGECRGGRAKQKDRVKTSRGGDGLPAGKGKPGDKKKRLVIGKAKGGERAKIRRERLTRSTLTCARAV